MTERQGQTGPGGGQSSRWWRLGASLPLALAVTLPPFVLVPVQIHSANPYDFSAALPDLMPQLLLLAGIAAAMLLAALLLVPRVLFRSLAAVLSALALMIWVQGQLVVWDYGVLDGTPIEWGAYPWRTVTDLVLWLGVISTALLFRKWLWWHAGLLSAMLLLVQAAPGIQAWNSVAAYPDFHRYGLDESSKFSFSSSQNVIVVVLDAFQSDVFHAIIDDEPRWRNEFDGFTYFRNALAGYSKTYPSLALMLSGEWYDNDEPIQEFVRRTFLADSLPRKLLQEDWRVDLFPHIKRVVHVSPRVTSNAVLSLSCEVRYREAGMLADLGLFRVSPHWAKRLWLNEYHWRLARKMPKHCDGSNHEKSTQGAEGHTHAALTFVSELQAGADVHLERPAFKLYHLLIPHGPFQIDESLTMTRMAGGREGFVRQSVASLEMVSRLLDQLHRLEIYDQSTIMVVSDHGGGEYSGRVDYDVLGEQFDRANLVNESVPATHLASGLPLVLIKPPGVRGDLAISDVPVSLGDLAHTVGDLIEVPHEYAGLNMFELTEDSGRERKYRFYQFSSWSGEYLPEMTEYLVDGFSWFSGNWKLSGKVLKPSPEQERPKVPTYRLGRVIRMHPASPYVSMLGPGWSEPHAEGFVWSSARRAELEINLDEPVAGALVARFDFQPFTAHGAIEVSEIELEVNGTFHHSWQAKRRGWYELRIPRTVLAESESLHFQFHFPDAASPLEFDLSGDQRLLGIALHRMALTDTIGEVE